MRGQRQKNQMELAFMTEEGVKPAEAVDEGTEPRRGTNEAESPVSSAELMEQVCGSGNLWQAWKKVRANRGCPGADRMTIEQAAAWLKQHWPEVREQLLRGGWRPQPVLRVTIPKPDGGERKLGIPGVIDRLIQQALLQVLQGQWDAGFSRHSYGFRPGRSAHQAVAQAQQYIGEGYGWVVDLDLEKFFDRVNHDRLLQRLGERIGDRRVLELIRRYLKAGVMEDGLVKPVDEGTPQGGPLSPLLSNLVLDELDRELEKRGHRFVRYADDCNIYVRSRRAGERVMQSVTRLLQTRLKLQVNEAKSAVARPAERKFLGFSFQRRKGTVRRRIAPKALLRYRERVRELTRRNGGRSLQQTCRELAVYLRGWLGYFGRCQTPSVLKELEQWTHRRLRAVAWAQWNRGRTRYAALIRLGVNPDLAAQTAGSPKGVWRVSCSPALHMALPTAHWYSLGLPPLVPHG